MRKNNQHRDSDQLQDAKGKQGVDQFPESEPVKSHGVSKEDAQKGKKVDADPSKESGKPVRE